MKSDHTALTGTGQTRHEAGDCWKRPTKVLIVDDETDVRLLLRVWFEQAGFRVVEAANGVQALALVGQGVNLVVTDLMMPLMDGRTFIAALRRTRSTAHVPVVVVTAAPEAGIEAEAVFTKPFMPSELIEVARSLLGDGDCD